MPSFLKNPYLQSFLLGAIMVLAMPPFYATPLFWLCLPAFLYVLRDINSGWRVFLLGWLFGLGFFVFGLYWISVALTVDLAKFWWLMPFALFGLPSYFSVFWGLAAVATKYSAAFIISKTPFSLREKVPEGRMRGLSAGITRDLLAPSFASREPPHPSLRATRKVYFPPVKGEGNSSRNLKITETIFFPIFLTFAEFARGHVLTGFPWNLPGYGWVGWLPVLQSVSVIGIYGLTFLTLMAACLPFLFFALPRKQAVIVNTCAVAVFVLIALWGWQRLEQHPTVFYDNYKFRLVQPNIPQGEKWDDQHRINNFNTLLKLSLQDRGMDVTHIVWPETAVPFIVAENDIVRTSIQSVVPPGGVLMTGALRREWSRDNPDDYQLFNSIEAIDADGRIIGHYDKSHLVPFGEYMPLRNLIPLPAVAAQFSDLGEGKGAETFQWGNLPPLGALICYEVIFPGDVTNRINKPSWLLNVTNDGWYGNTTGPYQHLAMSITRAVEEGVPLVRAANTGISAVIDPLGRVVARTKLGEQGFVDSRLPKFLN